MFIVKASGEPQAPLGAACDAETTMSRHMPLLTELRRGSVGWRSYNMALLTELSPLPGIVKYAGWRRGGPPPCATGSGKADHSPSKSVDIGPETTTLWESFARRLVCRLKKEPWLRKTIIW